MFERYTERARRVVFFARYEASQFGSPIIETEHLLLGLVRENPNLLKKMAPLATADEVRRRVQEGMAKRDKVSTSIDLPLSDECKRILAYSAEESERFSHKHIGTEHLLLGVLREPECVAARVLAGFGLALDPFRESLQTEGAVQSGDTVESLETGDRSHIHSLVDRLPESALSLVTGIMERMVAGRAPGTVGPVQFVKGTGLGRPRPDVSGSVAEGRFSTSHAEGSAMIVETQQFHHGHQIFITERFDMSEDGKTLSYSQDVVGPKSEQRHRHAMEFNVE